MTVQDLLERQANLIKLKKRIGDALAYTGTSKNRFQFGGHEFTQSDLVEEVLRPMMEQYLVNTQAELDKVNDLVKSINCLIQGTMPEKIKV